MTPQDILSAATSFALIVMAIALLLTVWRALKGPTLPDRIIALDMLVAIAIGFIAALALKTGFYLYVDIAISLGLVGFLATVAFARFVLSRGRTEAENERSAAAQSAARSGGHKSQRGAQSGRKSGKGRK